MEHFHVPLKQIAHVRGYADRQLRYPDQPYDVRNRRISIAILYNT
jgi:flagellar motor protein MotB